MSTAKQAQEGDSLEGQELIGRSLADRRGWQILRVFLEPYSGRKDARPMIDEIVGFIKANTKPVHYYIFKGIDRLTRAGVVEYQLLKDRIEALGVTVVDSYGLIQPKQNTLDHVGFAYDWSVYSPSEAAELLEAHRGKQEVRDILTRMIGAEIKLTQDGYKVRQPADGFLNKRVDVDGKKRVIEIPDPERAPYLIEMLTLRAARRLSDKEIVARVNAMGYRSKPHRVWSPSKDRIVGYTTPKLLTVKRLQEIIQRPIYCGVRREKWTHDRPIRTAYPGLVSIEVFNRANRGKVCIDERPDGSLAILYRGATDRLRQRRLKHNPLYPYKTVVLCPVCRTKPFLGSASRGRLGTYYCAYHCNRGHYFRVPKGEFETTIEACLESLRLKPTFVPVLEEALMASYERRRDEISRRTRDIDRNLAALRVEQESAMTSLLAAHNSLVRQKLEERVVALEERISQAARHTADPGLTEGDVHGFVRWAEGIMEHPVERLKQSHNTERQQAEWSLVFEALPTYEEMLNGTPKLSLAFALNRDFTTPQSVSARTQRFGWNTLEAMIVKWKDAFTKHPGLAAGGDRAPQATYRRGGQQVA